MAGDADALGSRFHVYALDQRSHGDSGRPDGDYSAEEYAPDLALFFRVGTWTAPSWPASH